MSHQCLSGGSEFESKVGYSRAVIDGNYVFVSGTTGFDYATMEISEDPVQQAEQTFRNIAAALESAGSHLDRVVRVRYIFTDKLEFEPCWPVLNRYLGTARPAATLIIAGLLDERMKLEIEVTATRV